MFDVNMNMSAASYSGSGRPRYPGGLLSNGLSTIHAQVSGLKRQFIPQTSQCELNYRSKSLQYVMPDHQVRQTATIPWIANMSNGNELKLYICNTCLSSVTRSVNCFVME